MNIGIPSIIVKMLRQKFDQQWSVRKTQATEEARARVLRLIRPSILQTDIRLHGPTLSIGEILDLDEGDVLAFDYPLSKPVDMLVNGRLKYRGEVGYDPEAGIRGARFGSGGVRCSVMAEAHVNYQL